MNRVLSIFDERGRRIAEVDADGGVARVIHDHGEAIEVTVTVTRGGSAFDAELPTCHDVWCSRCHPTHDIPARPSWGEVITRKPEPTALPSAFSYLTGDTHAQ